MPEDDSWNTSRICLLVSDTHCQISPLLFVYYFKNHMGILSNDFIP